MLYLTKEYILLNIKELNKTSYLNIWLILDFGIENLRNTRRKRIIIKGLGALSMLR